MLERLGPSPTCLTDVRHQGGDTVMESPDQPRDRISGDAGLEWLKTHTLQDIRNLTNELSNYGEDVTELVNAVNDLELLARGRASIEAREHDVAGTRNPETS